MLKMFSRAKPVCTLALMVGMTAFALGCKSSDANNNDNNANSSSAAASKDIVDTAVAAGSFGTLAELLTTAGLVETLKGAGPFTVFAPTDDAFKKIDAATLAAVKADKAKLAGILKAHVVSGKVMSGDVKDGMDVATLNGTYKAKVGSGKVMVGDSTVTKADIACSNGVIHVIDTVIMPK